MPCNKICGDEIVLRVRHDEDKYLKKGCIHMSEIEAYGVRQDIENIGMEKLSIKTFGEGSSR